MKCAIYIRVSKNCDEQMPSVDNQKDFFINYALENNLDIYDFYIDIQSGSKPKLRKNLQRMIDDAKSKKFDIILSKELSRLAGNGQISYALRDLAENINIDMRTLDNAIDTSIGNVENFGLHAWLFEQEAQNTSKRVKLSLNTKAIRGEFKSGTPPYGYHLKDSKLIVNDDETPFIVKRIFSEYLSGICYDAIARKLYKEKVRTPSQCFGKSNAFPIWHGATVRGILSNAHYMGNLVQSKTETKSATSMVRVINSPEKYIIVEDTHEAIIDKKTFELVNSLLNSRKRIKPKAQKHLFSNLLFCADCGKGMHFKRNRKGYVCGSFDKWGKVACESHIVRELNLIEIISNEFKNISSAIDNVDYIKKIQSSLLKDVTKKEKNLNQYIAKLNHSKSIKNKALRSLFENEITKEAYNSFICDIDIEINQYTEHIKKLELELSKHKDTTNLSKLQDIQTYIKDFSKLTPELLNRFIEKIEIKKDGSPKIYYRFSDASIYFSDLINFTQVSQCGVFGNISIHLTILIS
ncbi:TPA: recombinase family protein [Clostridioides difficile]